MYHACDRQRRQTISTQTSLYRQFSVRSPHSGGDSSMTNSAPRILRPPSRPDHVVTRQSTHVSLHQQYGGVPHFHLVVTCLLQGTELQTVNSSFIFAVWRYKYQYRKSLCRSGSRRKPSAPRHHHRCYRYHQSFSSFDRSNSCWTPSAHPRVIC